MMPVEKLYEIFQRHPVVQTDTRQLQPGDLFFALKGSRFNGNLFVRQALEKGTAYAITEETLEGADERVIYVEDSLGALQALAKYHRQQLNIPFLAITGSNGKTTTKELINTVLSTTYLTYATQGNLNNHIGIPLTILKIKTGAQLAVIEMGANHLGEIAGYCQYVIPTHGLITNVGKAHLEGFGGLEGVKKGKGELYDFLKSNGGTAFVMWDYDYLQQMSAGISDIIRYGTHNADVTGRVIRSEPLLEVELTDGTRMGPLRTQLVGDYNLPNVLSAVAVGRYFKVEDEQIRRSIESYLPSNSRSQMIEKDGNHIILDAYNANPTSMKAAIENFAKLPAAKKILILGAMAELGQEGLKEHELILELIDQHNWDKVVLVGGDFLRLPSSHLYFSSAAEAGSWFRQAEIRGAHVLIKGSRSMQMEKILD